MSDDSHWVERAQTAEAQLKTLREVQGAAIERIKVFKANFGVRECGNGEIEIDFQKLVERLGAEGAAELLKVIHEKYGEIGRNITATEVLQRKAEPISAPKRKYVRKAKPVSEAISR